MKLKILSWNIWVDGHFGLLKDFLAAADADIIGLQEVKDDDPDRDVIGYLAGNGYHPVFARTEQVWGGKTYRHGPAIFSRLPVVHSATYLIDEHDQRAAAQADVDVHGTVLHVFSTHLVHTHQERSDAQESQAQRLMSILPEERTLVMGDFNATPESATITMMEKRFVNTDPNLAPTWSVYPEGCTVCDPHAIDTRLDYIFASKDLRTESPRVGNSEASDHLPISVSVWIE